MKWLSIFCFQTIFPSYASKTTIVKIGPCHAAFKRSFVVVKAILFSLVLCCQILGKKDKSRDLGWKWGNPRAKQLSIGTHQSAWLGKSSFGFLVEKKKSSLLCYPAPNWPYKEYCENHVYVKVRERQRKRENQTHNHLKLSKAFSSTLLYTHSSTTTTSWESWIKAEKHKKKWFFFRV